MSPALLALFLLGCQDTAPPALDMCVELDALTPVSRRDPPGGLVYELYVRSFQDTDGDGIGDIAGVRARLPYLQSIGVTTIWLMPVFPSPGPTGYDVETLDQVRADYGGEGQLWELVDIAAERGIDIVLDAPINHTAVTHPWFQTAVADDSSVERHAYLFSHEQWDELRWFPAEDGSWYYAYFGADFPDLDWSSALVSSTVERQLGRWLDEGVAGLRLDAVRQLVEDDGNISDTETGHCTLAWIYNKLGSDRGLTLSEAWSDDLDVVLPYLGSDDAPEADVLLGVPRHAATGDAFQAIDATLLTEQLQAEADAGVLFRLGNYVGNHDIMRFRDRFPEARLRRAWMVSLLTLPGVPVLYYGDEIDLRGADHDQQQDLPWRNPMAWTPEIWGGFTTGTPWMEPVSDYIDGGNVQDQLQDPYSLLRLVQGLADLRAATSALDTGELVVHDSGMRGVLAYERRALDDDVSLLVLINLGTQPVDTLTLRSLGEVAWYELTADNAERHYYRTDVGLQPLGYRVLASQPVEGLTVPPPPP